MTEATMTREQSKTLQARLKEEREELFSAGSHFLPANREDIVGIDNVVRRIEGLIDWLRNSEYYSKYGARLEPGVLFEGAPGTGKTLCARHIATESEARFINVRDFPTTHDYATAQDIAVLFAMARAYYKKTGQPVVLFWDEFEGYAKDRGSKGLSLKDTSVVSQITSELDGVDGKIPGVLFIGCTNYKNAIDEALLRPGRMGVHVKFTAPDRRGKEVLLQHYLGKYKTAENVDCEVASYFFDTHDTAAAVEETVGLVWRFAVGRSLKEGKEPVITNEDISNIFLDRLLGIPPTYSDLTQEDRFNVAIHELGHALVAYKLGVAIRIITVRPGSDSMGRAIIYKPNHLYANVDDIRAQIAVGLGSMTAEWVAGIPNSVHSESDTGRASQLAVFLSESWGQGPRNTARLNPQGIAERNKWVSGSMSEGMKQRFDERVIEILQTAEGRAKEVLLEVGRHRIREMAHRLLESETFTGAQFKEMVDDVCRSMTVTGAPVGDATDSPYSTPTSS